MRSQRAVVDALLNAGSYRGIRAALPAFDLQPSQRRTIQVLCDFAVSILDVDAEDWTAFPGVPGHLRDVARAANMPTDPRAVDRGALESLVAPFAIMQEIANMRFRQGDLSGLLTVCHIMSEYLPLLAWEPHLGHAADPPRMAVHVTREGSLWGIDASDPRSRDCAHSPSIRGSLRELVRVGRPRKDWSAQEHRRIWSGYLDHDHSRVSGALATCGLLASGARPRPLRACPTKCSVWSSLTGDREALADRLAIAGVFVESPMISLRHAAPVGHGFGVPSVQELAQAWTKTWEQLSAQWSERQNPLAAAEPMSAPAGEQASEPLPGLGLMISAVAGRPVPPTTVFREVDALIRTALAD